jgi:hypothetical protein
MGLHACASSDETSSILPYQTGKESLFESGNVVVSVIPDIFDSFVIFLVSFDLLLRIVNSVLQLVHFMQHFVHI